MVETRRASIALEMWCQDFFIVIVNYNNSGDS
jgi:hypothetical protein